MQLSHKRVKRVNTILLTLGTAVATVNDMRYRVGGGLLMGVTLWHVDAMMAHIAVASWYTLATVGLMLLGQWADIFTAMHIGNLAEELHHGPGID